MMDEVNLNIPMSEEEQLRRDLVDYGDVPTNPGHPLNKYIVKNAKRELKKYPGVKVNKVPNLVNMTTFKQYKAMTVKELKDIAKKLGVHKYYDLKEDDLINEIMKKH